MVWVCCWFSLLLREVFLRVLRFSPTMNHFVDVPPPNHYLLLILFSLFKALYPLLSAFFGRGFIKYFVCFCCSSGLHKVSGWTRWGWGQVLVNRENQNKCQMSSTEIYYLRTYRYWKFASQLDFAFLFRSIVKCSFLDWCKCKKIRFPCPICIYKIFALSFDVYLDV